MTHYQLEVRTPGWAGMRDPRVINRRHITPDDPCERGARFHLIDEDGTPLVDFELEWKEN